MPLPSLPLPSSVLLLREVEPLNLHGNTPLITDFGLAREIQHTTHMSGAGTFAWMAPEVIRTSVYSKASDVWRYVCMCVHCSTLCVCRMYVRQVSSCVSLYVCLYCLVARNLCAFSNAHSMPHEYKE